MIAPFFTPIVRGVVVVEVPDAAKYLQGQLSQDIDSLAVGGWAWSLLLQPQGKLEAWLRVHRAGDDRYELDVDEGFAEVVEQRLARFMIRTDAVISTTRRAMFAVRNAEADGAPIAAPASAFDDAPAGADLVGEPVGIAPGSAEDLERWRIEAGIPAMGSELGPDTIPAEAGAWLIDVSVSFTKGCYVGQELVARVDSRGSNTPRHLRRIRVEGAVPPVGSEVVVEDRAVGTLTSVAVTDLGAVGLSMVHRSVGAPADVRIRWADGDTPAGILSEAEAER